MQGNLILILGAEGIFLQTIKAIYTKKKAKIKINGQVTEIIQIEQGTRQGCPLSLLLIIQKLEILNRQIRGNAGIKGLRIRGEEFKLQAYADDLAIIVENPLDRLEELVRGS